MVIAPPSGEIDDPHCDAVEALIDTFELYPGTTLTRFFMRLQLEAGELERLQAGEAIWLRILAPRLVPFQVDVEGE